jgi:hypothetical protein
MLAAAMTMVTTVALISPVVLGKRLTYAAAEVQKLFTYFPFHLFRQYVHRVATNSPTPPSFEATSRADAALEPRRCETRFHIQVRLIDED